MQHRLSRWSRRAWISGVTASVGMWSTRTWADDERVLEEARSEYSHIVVTEQGTVRTMYFVVDDTYYIESRWDRGFPKSLDLDYSRTMMAGYLVKPNVESILMIGFGGGQISNYLFDRFPGLKVDGVDIDGEVIRLARAYFDVPNHVDYQTHAADGRIFVEQAAGRRWDMIILDAFRGVFVPFHLKTVEYYTTLLEHLSPDGVVVANLHSETPMYKHDRNTFATVFPQGYCFRSESGRQATFVASASPRPVGAYTMREHAERLQTKFDFDLPGLAARWYLGTDWYLDAPILRDDFPIGATPEGAERHNQRCRGSDCRYPTRP